MTDATDRPLRATGSFLRNGASPLARWAHPALRRAGSRTRSAADDPAAHADVETAFVNFNMAIVDATADLVCAYKPNAAFYERHGAAGWNALARTIAYIHSRYPAVPVLLDAKRGDIGNTAAGLRRRHLRYPGRDAVTLHPYLGSDALQPFLKRADRGCFILSHTSNPGAGESNT